LNNSNPTKRHDYCPKHQAEKLHEDDGDISIPEEPAPG